MVLRYVTDITSLLLLVYIPRIELQMTETPFEGLYHNLRLDKPSTFTQFCKSGHIQVCFKMSPRHPDEEPKSKPNFTLEGCLLHKGASSLGRQQDLTLPTSRVLRPPNLGSVMCGHIKILDERNLLYVLQYF